MNKKVCIGLMLLFTGINTVAMNTIEHPFLYKPNNMVWGIEAIYFKPDNLDENSSQVSLTNDVIEIELDTAFKWGFQLTGDYLFNDAKNAKLEWIHYDNTENNLRREVDELKGEGPTTIPYGYVSRFEILNFELGEWRDLFNGFAYRIHGGLEYAYMNTSHHFNYITNTSGSSQAFKSEYLYHMIGGRAGVDLNYKFTQKLQFNINSALALLDTYGRYNKINHLINRTPAGAIISRSDIDENSKLRGGLASLDTYLSFSYKNQKIANGKLSLNAGVRSIVFMQETIKWGGGFIGALWVGQI